MCLPALTELVRSVLLCAGHYSFTKFSRFLTSCSKPLVYVKIQASWNVMAHAQKPDFVFRRNGQVHLKRRERQFSRLLTAEECASAVVMLDTPCSEVVWRVLATHSIGQFPLHFACYASLCAITFQLASTPRLTETGLRQFRFRVLQLVDMEERRDYYV